MPKGICKRSAITIALISAFTASFAMADVINDDGMIIIDENIIEEGDGGPIDEDDGGIIITPPQFDPSFSIGVAPLTSVGNAQTLAEALISDGISTITNINYTGSLNASGLFTNAVSSIGIDTGLLLTSGSAANVIGPNTFTGVSSSNGSPGDDLLNSLIPGYTTNDAAILSFDFVPQGNQLEFSYVFGSDEYNEFVDSTYNDVFGFFVNGVNYATLPNGNAVSINNVNNDSNSAFYIDNSSGQLNTELDGLTTVLSFVADVTPGISNTIQLGIADAGDSALDSAVFINGDFSSVVSNEAQAGDTQLNPIMPDAIVPETNGFAFTFDKPDGMIFIDPEVAIGYVYEVTSDHIFESLLLPLIGDGEYILNIYDDVLGEFAGNYSIENGIIYTFDAFTAEEVTLFQILGIETDAALDPTDSLAFVTGLSFGFPAGTTNTDPVNMTQTAIVFDTGTTASVPAPMTIVLLGLGLVLMIRKRKA